MSINININLCLKSFNCRGLRNKIKRQSIFNWLNDQNKSICLLQETHSCELDEKQWQLEFNGDIFYSHGTCNSKGVAILIPKSLKTELEIKNTYKDKDARILTINCIREKRPLTIINVYAPTKDNSKAQLEFGDILSEIVERNSDTPLIIGGDFNVCLNPMLDKKGNNIVSCGNYRNKLENVFMKKTMCP